MRMPAEWEPHRATWISWPHHEPDWPGKLGPIPWVYAEIVRHLVQSETVTFFTGPKQMGPVPVGDLLWMTLMDSIHHRGQMSVYIRVAGGKVPSIYGPTADEPWN
jgi:hypothetical protein